MTLPIAMLLSEWTENRRIIDTIDEEEEEEVEEEECPPEITKYYMEKPYTGSRTRITERPQKVHQLRKPEFNLKLILLKLDSLLRPNLKFKKFVPQAINSKLPLTSYRKLKSRKTPPLPKHHPYNSDSLFKINSFTCTPTSNSVPNKSENPAEKTSNKWIQRRVKKTCPTPVKFPREPEICTNLNPVTYVESTLGDYFKFKTEMNDLKSLPKDRQVEDFRGSLDNEKFRFSSLCEHVHEEKKVEEKQQVFKALPERQINIQPSQVYENISHNSDKSAKESSLTESNRQFGLIPSYPFQEDCSTEILKQIRETNTKLNGIVRGMRLDILAPFNYFDEGVFTQDMVIHKALYASRLFIRHQEPKDKEKSSTETTEPFLLTCDQLEMALTSKLSVHAVPFTYKPKNSEEKSLKKAKVNMEAFMEFLSNIIDNTSLTPPESDAGSDENYLVPIFVKPAVEPKENANPEPNRDHEEAQMNIDDLQGQTLTPEEENGNSAARMSPIGGQLTRKRYAEPARQEPQQNISIWYGGRDILDLGSNIRQNQWGDFHRWQVGPDMSEQDPDTRERDREWRRRESMRDNYSFVGRPYYF